MIRASWLIAALALATLVALPVGLPAQGEGADQVAELAEKITSEDATVREQAFVGLLAMGSEGIEALLAILVEPGGPSDAGARFALHGMAAHVARPGAEREPERGRLITGFIAYVDGDHPTEPTGFVITQMQIVGGPEVIPALTACLKQEELALAAIQALAANVHPDAAAALRDALPDAQGTVRIGIIEALGQKADPEAVNLLIDEARSDDLAVQLAARHALGRIGDNTAAPVVLDAMDKGEPRQQRSAFAAGLLLGEQLAARGERKAARAVYVRALEAAATPGQRSAALLGIGKVGSADDTEAMLPHLADPDPTVRHAAAQSLAGLPDADTGAALAEATRSAAPEIKMGLLRILAQRDEPAARRAIEEAAKSDHVSVRVTALEVLGQLEDPAVEGTLLEAIKSGPGPAYETAITAYLQQARARRDRGDSEDARGMYWFALKGATTDHFRRMALEGLATVPAPSSRETVEPYLDNPEVRDSALRAYVAVAGSIAPDDRDQAIAMLTRAVEMGPPRDVAQAAVGKLRELGMDIDPARAAGFVTQWWIIGPFAGADVDKEYPPETAIDVTATVKTEDRELKWAQHRTADPSGIVNLAGMMKPNTNGTAYLYAEVTVAAAQDVLIKTGSDDGMKLWLNGKAISRFPDPRSLKVDEDTTEMRLEAGASKLLYKVVQGGGGWECCLRITDRDGKPIKFTQ